jgi:serine/threonine-protein kinase
MGATVLFDRYRLLERAGRGGMADVWRAADTRTGEDVAVKRLHPLVFASRVGRDRLLREFRAVRSLDHPNIVRVRDLELTNDDGALILDYVAGPSVRDRLGDGPPIDADEAIAIAGAVAAGLAEAHRRGIVHRDVTPGNILLDTESGARLTDFGIALGSADADAATMTGTGRLVGTLAYLAPEQLRGEPATSASDLFSLAAVTYQMLAGRPPFEATTPVGLVEAHRHPPAPIDGLPEHVNAAVRRALALEPRERQRSVDAFAGELRAPMVRPLPPSVRPARSVRPVAGLIAVGFGALVLAALALGGPAPAGQADALRSTSPTLSQPEATHADGDDGRNGGNEGRGNGNGNGNGGGGNGNGNGNDDGGDD